MTTTRRIGAVLGAIVLAGTAGLAQVPPAPPQTTADEAAPAGGQILGRALLGRNDPVVGAVVVVRPDGVRSAYRATATDARGAFRFDGLPEGSWTCTIDKDGLRPIVKTAIDVRAPYRAVVEVTMEKGTAPPPPPPAPSGGAASLSGVVVGEALGGLAETRVRLVPAGGRGDPKTALTAPDGSFALEGLSAGRFDLEIEGPGFLPIRTTLDLAGEATLAARLVPQPPGYEPHPEDLMPLEQPIPPR